MPTAGPQTAGTRRSTVTAIIVLRSILCLLAVTVWLGSGQPALSGGLSAAEADAVRRALKAADDGKWSEARRQAQATRAPVLQKYIHWLYLGGADSGAPFDAIVGFVDRNPHWPGRRQLLRRAEDALAGASPGEIAAWFRSHPPRSTPGRVLLAETLIAMGDTARGTRLLREAWVGGTFTRTEERSFLARHQRSIQRKDHVDRLDRLIWSRHYSAARRMLLRVDRDQQNLALARIALAGRAAGVDSAIARVPATLRDHPGLVFERAKWRRRKGRFDGAMALLLEQPDGVLRPDLWWREREIVARWALREGFVSEAYRLASAHGLRHGGPYVAAEWLSGWIALRFLSEPARARPHFLNAYGAAYYPISRSRGAYWIGRAAEAQNNPVAAASWYRTAAYYGTTYYGQLARARLSGPAAAPPAVTAAPSIAETSRFRQRELVRLVALLVRVGAEERLGDLLQALDDRADSPGAHLLVSDLANASGRADLALRIGKHALRDDLFLPTAGYPLLPGGISIGAGDALVHAVIRQESAFKQDAISRAGARGLMQLMPATARLVARGEGLPYSRGRLLSDPAYNIRLGSSYLDGLLKRFDGSQILSLAGYNAGPHRVGAWIRAFGDPRDPTVDPVDWVEMIPFSETRNYVQRVLENVPVYRGLLNAPSRPDAGPPG